MKTAARELTLVLPVVAFFIATAAAVAQVQTQPAVKVLNPPAIEGRAARQLVKDRIAEQVLASQPPAPPALAIYGPAKFGIATPLPTPADDFYSGAHARPCNFNHWYGNGYNW